MKVLLSIKPEFVEKIFNGEKQYEYRKSIFKKGGVDTIVVYSTKPEGKIVGELTVEKILQDDIEILWENTKSSSGTTYDFFKKYFQGKETGYAIKIKKAIKYDAPLSPFETINNFHAPQSFCYIN
ncbi:ASCH domain-containing protein [Salibacterium halotolerans]|uniref:Predicted transcriptional regulator, contains an HTH and PUA-like domains n=1 Tax=Salibacterium halotolerans TaxID=1884432 RepID=A0A1I5N8K5_9BACI|nr:ASCH domain-containing protein [Salibacterium halotolerans]SFP18179.1 Predicted transcriptional regulator, contains an HTH and PUA-like domains [Salibacterium halotolerans]